MEKLITCKIRILCIYDRSCQIEKKFFTIGIPREVYAIIQVIQAAFMLSHNIRKNTTLLLVFQEEGFMIKYIGKELHFLGPDARSIGLLLMKALTKRNLLERRNIYQSTPGIWIEKVNMDELLERISKDYEIIIADEKLDVQLTGFQSEKRIMLLLNNTKSPLEIQKEHSWKIGAKNQPNHSRAFLTILKFYSIFDNLKQEKENEIK
ncbi:MAG: hypothetical protein EU536_02055 [Promethearchaeota archaeon]|nr:MAG: hypothetical protein EU536_02055 [Candidatus Lokiarchaeota archaeon]